MFPSMSHFEGESGDKLLLANKIHEDNFYDIRAYTNK